MTLKNPTPIKRSKPRVVIAGFGDTGLLVAVHLKKRYEIIGISPKPCLISGQELGTRLTKPEQWQNDYLIGFNRYKALKGVKTIQGLIQHIAADKRQITVTTADGKLETLSYDILVLASGVSNGFWRDNTIQTLEQIQQQLTDQSTTLLSSHKVAIIGGGPTGASVASNLKENNPECEVNLFFSQAQPLPGYHPKVRAFIERKLIKQGVQLHPEHRAHIPNQASRQDFTHEAISWQTGQADFKADLTLWAIGRRQPNNHFIPDSWLTDDGYVKADQHLRVPGTNNIYTVGDIADSDPNRSSARNAGFLTVAHNIDVSLQGKPHKMKRYKASQYRWGSILGVQNEGMRVFTPTGSNLRVNRWWVFHLLFPFFVRKLIYKGISR